MHMSIGDLLPLFGILPSVRVLLAAGLVLLTACGDGGDKQDESGDPQGSLFDCAEETCDGDAGEFCLVEYYANGELDGGTCVQAACSDCDCAEDAALAYFDGASNCSGMIGCSQDDAQITVECTNPSM